MNELDNIKAASTMGSVETALAQVQQLASAPIRFRDPPTLMAALQKLADDARISGYNQAAEYEAILRQCRPSYVSTRVWGHNHPFGRIQGGE